MCICKYFGRNFEKPITKAILFYVLLTVFSPIFNWLYSNATNRYGTTKCLAEIVAWSNQNYTFFVFIFIVFGLTWICKGFEFCCCGYDPISRGQTQICLDFQSFCRFRTQSVQNWGFLNDPAPIYNEVSWLVLV